MTQNSITGKTVLVTGGAGFSGHASLPRTGSVFSTEILVPRSADDYLREPGVVRELFAEHRPEVVVHLAAVVGGIGANRKNPGKYFYDNASMAIHLMEEAESPESRNSFPSLRFARIPNTLRCRSKKMNSGTATRRKRTLPMASPRRCCWFKVKPIGSSTASTRSPYFQSIFTDRAITSTWKPVTSSRP